MQQVIPIQTLHLFPVLDRELIALLRSLNAEEWKAPTVAKKWCVKDVAAHLLDGTLRNLSIGRDQYIGDPPSAINSYDDLVAYLNRLNHDWTGATRRLSPKVLIDLLEQGGNEYTDYLHSLDPFADAIFSVAWAGQERSPNWFHIAREYTEKFLHQQQIRDALHKPGIMTEELYKPFLDTFMYALPFTYRSIDAPVATIISVVVDSSIGGEWQIRKEEDGWAFNEEMSAQFEARLTIDPDTAWKLFSKSWSPAHVFDNVTLEGNKEWAAHALTMISVMA